MGTITIQVVETGFSNLTKTYNVADGDIDKITAAYQSQANSAVNGTATRPQVWLWIADNVFKQPIVQQVQQMNTVPAVVPSPISVS